MPVDRAPESLAGAQVEFVARQEGPVRMNCFVLYIGLTSWNSELLKMRKRAREDQWDWHHHQPRRKMTQRLTESAGNLYGFIKFSAAAPGESDKAPERGKASN